jgi:hypothetical protein
VQHDDGAYLFPVVVVGDADDGDFEDVRVLVEDLLDLAGVNLVAAAVHHVLLAVHDVQIAVAV